jgi:hypothetical protein
MLYNASSLLSSCVQPVHAPLTGKELAKHNRAHSYIQHQLRTTGYASALSGLCFSQLLSARAERTFQRFAASWLARKSTFNSSGASAESSREHK